MTFVEFKLIFVGVLKAWFPNKKSLDKLSDNNGIGSYNNKKITISESEDNLLTEDETGILLSQDNIPFSENTSSNPSDNASDGNPVGTIISFYGLTAPDGYLICDGSTYNREDYPNLSLHLTTNFEDLAGDGSTTFTVPDLQGEFLRGAGENSRANQGSGASVGVHQDATNHLYWFNTGTSTGDGRWFNYNNPNGYGEPKNTDTEHTTSSNRRSVSGSYTDGYGGSTYYTSRPTNTSILYCIKY